MEDQRELKRVYLERRQYYQDLVLVSGGIPKRPRRLSELPGYIESQIIFHMNIACAVSRYETPQELRGAASECEHTRPGLSSNLTAMVFLPKK